VSGDEAYGLWPLVVLNTGLFSVFAASFFHPRTSRDRRAMGAFSAFLVALFTEIYGIPLTVYLLSGWLGNRIPALQATHAGGHLWNDMIGWSGDPHTSPFHLASYLAIGGGFWLLAAAWRVLLQAARAGRLVTGGPYRRVRHPQYAGLLLVLVGFLLQWPTIPTLVMFPVLVCVYRRLAVAKEREVAARFGPAWVAYAAATPRFVPRLGQLPPAGTAGVGEPTAPTHSPRPHSGSEV